MTKTNKEQEKSYYKDGKFNSGLFRNAVIKRMKESNLSASARLVLLALLDYAHDKAEVWPSITGIEKFTGFKRRAIFNIIKDLEDSHFIKKDKIPKKNGIGNSYTILATSAFKTPVMKLNRCIKNTSTSALNAPELVHEMHPNTKSINNFNIKAESDFFSENEGETPEPQEQEATHKDWDYFLGNEGEEVTIPHTKSKDEPIKKKEEGNIFLSHPELEERLQSFYRRVEERKCSI